MLMQPHNTKGLEVVLIEDSLLDARLTIESLKRCRIYHRLTLFRDGAQAIDFLNRDGVFKLAPTPDIILLDLVLPDTDGVSFLRRLRADESLGKIPVVILTSVAEDQRQKECEQLGVSSYIRKPFHEDKFLNVIRELNVEILKMDKPSGVGAYHLQQKTATPIS